MSSNNTCETSRKMKILWVCYSRILEFGHLSGSERIERLRHLSEEGHVTYLTAADFKKEKYQRNPNMHLISIPIRYVPLISPILYGLTLFFFLPIYLVKIRPEFLISDPSTAPFLIWKPFLSKLLKFKTILDIRSTPLRMLGSRRHLAAIAYFNISIWIAKTLFEGMTIVTPMMKEEICRSFNVNPKWVCILSNGVSDAFVPSERLNHSRTELRKKFGMSNRFVILYHGSFRWDGGLIESIQAIGLLKNDCPDVTLFLLGRSPSKDLLNLLRRTVAETNVQANVILRGAVDFAHVPEYISMSDLGIVPLPNNPNWRFQQPLKLLEYMAMKKPAIVSDIPAHRSILGTNKNGIYVSFVEPTELAKAMKYAYDNKDRLEEWGEIGQEIVMKQYAWNKVNKDLVDYLLKIELGHSRQKQ